MSNAYRIAADCIVVAHMGYVLTVVLGLPAIWWGIARKHRWAKNVWWRCGHLTMILIVVTESWAGITCPLTVWEQQLREATGGQTYHGTFLSNLVHNLLFYDLDPWVFTMLYTAFGSLVLASFIVAPPSWKQSSQESAPCRNASG